MPFPSGRQVGGDGTAPAAFIKRTSATELRFTASGVDGMSKKAISMQMMPLHEIMEEAYAVYFKCSGPPKPVVFAPGGATVPSADLSDWTLQNVESAGKRDAATTRSGVSQVCRVLLQRPVYLGWLT